MEALSSVHRFIGEGRMDGEGKQAERKEGRDGWEMDWW
jgi:hypothetical protein